jgi:hypothetical protein
MSFTWCKSMVVSSLVWRVKQAIESGKPVNKAGKSVMNDLPVCHIFFLRAIHCNFVA